MTTGCPLAICEGSLGQNDDSVVSGHEKQNFFSTWNGWTSAEKERGRIF
jgi:hypothetical protein